MALARWYHSGGGGFDGSGLNGSMGLSDGFSDFLVWETPVISIDDLIVSDPAHKFLAMRVPPLPKVRAMGVWRRWWYGGGGDLGLEGFLDLD